MVNLTGVTDALQQWGGNLLPAPHKAAGDDEPFHSQTTFRDCLKFQDDNESTVQRETWETRETR